MNKQFTDKQIKVYAEAFEAGDAIWCGNKWWEVFYEDGNLTNSSPSAYFVKNLYDKGVVEGFRNDCELSNMPHRVTTLEHYTPTLGDKVIWLRESGGLFTFGGVYNITEDYAGTLIILDDNGYEHSPYKKKYWGVIPKYSHTLKSLTKQEECCESSPINTETPQENLCSNILSQFESRIHNITDYLHYEITNSRKYKAKMLFESILESGYSDITAQINQDSQKLSKIISNKTDNEYAQLYKMSNQIQQMLETLILLDAVVEEKIQLHEQEE